jgi:uncharacterized protein (TIGR00369 family)
MGLTVHERRKKLDLVISRCCRDLARLAPVGTENDGDLIDLALLEHFMRERIAFNQLLGIDVVILERGYARLEVPFKAELMGDPDRPALHGGVLSSLMDTAGGAAGFTLVGPSDKVSTLDLRIDYLRPGEPRRLVAEARVTRMGNRVASIDIACFHDDAPERLIATGKGVYNVARKS